MANTAMTRANETTVAIKREGGSYVVQIARGATVETVRCESRDAAWTTARNSLRP